MMVFAAPVFRIRTQIVAAACLISVPAHAVRPFITDDARVVGDRAMQLETWLRADKDGIQHWMIPGVGFGPLELSLGAVYGAAGGDVGAALPLLQAKVLLHETKPGAITPGIALAASTFGPYGAAPLQLAHWDNFGYVALSESVTDDDRILLHQNVGVFASDGLRFTQLNLTWGAGTQIEFSKGICAVAEIFSGDPYPGKPSAAVQAGARYFLSTNVQMDATLGHGTWGESILPLWGSVGLRVASDVGFLSPSAAR